MRDGIIWLVVSCRIVSHNHTPALLSLFQWKVRRAIRPSSVARLNNFRRTAWKVGKTIAFYRDDDNDINNIKTILKNQTRILNRYESVLALIEIIFDSEKTILLNHCSDDKWRSWRYVRVSIILMMRNDILPYLQFT